MPRKPRVRSGHPCSVCSTLLTDSRVKGQTCKACLGAVVASGHVCPSCDGYKAAQYARLCQTCRFKARASGNEDHLLQGFIPAAFTVARKFAGWSISELSRTTGISVGTIGAWEAGRALPKRDTFARVARILAMDPCPTCGGSGWIDPSNPRVLRFLKRVTGVAS